MDLYTLTAHAIWALTVAGIASAGAAWCLWQAQVAEQRAREWEEQMNAVYGIGKVKVGK